MENNEWMDILKQDVSVIITEKVFNSNMEMIEGYHEAGYRIWTDLQLEDREQVYGKKIVQSLAKSLNLGTRKLYTMIQSGKKYGSLLPDLPKNITWAKYVRDFVSEGKTEEALPALPDKAYLKEVVMSNLDFLVDNLTQSKRGVSFFLPYDYVDSRLK